MNKTEQKIAENVSAFRPPVVAILGHVDHGKSTLLDYIRQTKTTEKEVGGITQHAHAYEAVHTGSDKREHTITFLDTPGHAAFRGIRERGANIADVAVLVVSGEDGVKPQTLEALSFIQKTNTPYLVAITKIDKPTANVETTKQGLAEHGVYLEGYGGDIPVAAVSSKTGEGILELLDLILLVAEMSEIGKNDGGEMKAFVIEADVEKRRGITATLIVKEGELKKGTHVVAGDAYTQTRCMENSLGESIEKARSGTPVRIIGWNKIPKVGALCTTIGSKKEAEVLVHERKTKRKSAMASPAETDHDIHILPLIIKADTSGSLEAVESEVMKQETERVHIKIVSSGVGAINESDAKSAQCSRDPVIVGFNVETDTLAKSVIERGGIHVETFDIIYKLVERLRELIVLRTPKVRVETIRASARIMKIFATEKDRLVVGGKVLEGELQVGDGFRISRRDAQIGEGKIRELRRMKDKVSSVPKDSEFGAAISATIEVVPGDILSAIVMSEE